MENEFSAAIYSRKSKFTGKGESIENQVEICRAFLRAKYPGTYRDEALYIFEDEGFSGAHVKRPEFSKMMKEAKEHKFSTIVCYRLDRISRNISDFAALIDELSTLGISFVSVKELFDTTQPMGRAMMYIASVFSQLERETIGERIKDNMEELAKDGRWLGGVTPTGYRSVKISENKKYKYVLEIVKEEAEAVKLMFDVFGTTRSLSKTAGYLNKKGMHTKNLKPHTPVSVKGILGNPVYMKADGEAYSFLTKTGAHIYTDKDRFNGRAGIMAYKKTLQKPGKTNCKLDISKWIVAVGAHEGLIGGAEWAEVYALLTSPTVKNDYALLSGIITCGLCGAFLITKKRSDKPGFYYACREKCGVKNLAGLSADEEILENIPPSSRAENLSLWRKREYIKSFLSAILWDGEGITAIAVTAKK